MATRGKSPEELPSSIWWNGPRWLKRPIKLWPHSERIIDDNTKNETENEVKDNKVLYEAKLISAEGLSKESIDLSDIDEQRYSSLYKLLRVTAWILRFINKLRKRNPKTGPLSTDEIQKAKLLWEAHIQRKHYSDTIKNLSKGKKDNLQRQLNLKLDENGIIRCHGRLANAEMKDSTKERALHQVDSGILPSKSLTLRSLTNVSTN